MNGGLCTIKGGGDDWEARWVGGKPPESKMGSHRNPTKRLSEKDAGSTLGSRGAEGKTRAKNLKQLLDLGGIGGTSLWGLKGASWEDRIQRRIKEGGDRIEGKGGAK